MRKLIGFALFVLVVSGCYGAPPEGGKGASASAPAVEGATLLADVSVSPTHKLYFYEGADAETLIAETYDIDRDRSVLQEHPLLREDGRVAELYIELAGEAADAAVFDQIQELDALALSTLAETGRQEPAPADGASLVGPAAMMAGENVEKDFWSEDADWFRVNHCNGCVGSDGTRQNIGEPAHWPTCTTSPEACAFFGAGTVSYERKSRNFNFTAVNFAFEGNLEMLGFLTNPRENCTWAQIVFTDCGAGGARLFQHFVQPRQWFGMTGSNHSQSWSRRFTTFHPGNVGFKVDLF